MRPFSRADRVGELIQRVLSEILQKKIKDPRLKTALITDVKMSRDLKHARAFFVLSGGKASQADAEAGFNQALGFFKRELGREMELRYMPELRFFYDESFDYASRIDELLKLVKTTNNGSDNL